MKKVTKQDWLNRGFVEYDETPEGSLEPVRGLRLKVGSLDLKLTTKDETGVPEDEFLAILYVSDGQTTVVLTFQDANDAWVGLNIYHPVLWNEVHPK